MVFWWVYVDGCLVIKVEVGVLWFCDIPVSYAKVVGIGIAAFAHVHRWVVLVSSCLNSPYHWLLMNSTGSYSLLGEYFLGM